MASMNDLRTLCSDPHPALLRGVRAARAGRPVLAALRATGEAYDTDDVILVLACSRLRMSAEEAATIAGVALYEREAPPPDAEEALEWMGHFSAALCGVSVAQMAREARERRGLAALYD